MISIKYKVENIKEHRTQVFLVQTPNSLKIHSNGWEAEILQTLGGAATPPLPPQAGQIKGDRRTRYTGHVPSHLPPRRSLALRST